MGIKKCLNIKYGKQIRSNYGIAAGNHVALVDTCYEKVKQSFNCRLKGPVTLKNKANAVMIYEVLN